MAGNSTDLWRLSYRSRMIIPADRKAAELDDIFATAVAFNGSHDITGALYVRDDSFGQVLEGPQDAVRSLYAKISADPRHADPSLSMDTHAVERVFPDWAMARVPDDDKADIAKTWARVTATLEGYRAY